MEDSNRARDWGGRAATKGLGVTNSLFWAHVFRFPCSKSCTRWESAGHRYKLQVKKKAIFGWIWIGATVLLLMGIGGGGWVCVVVYCVV